MSKLEISEKKLQQALHELSSLIDKAIEKKKKRDKKIDTNIDEAISSLEKMVK